MPISPSEQAPGDRLVELSHVPGRLAPFSELAVGDRFRLFDAAGQLLDDREFVAETVDDSGAFGPKPELPNPTLGGRVAAAGRRALRQWGHENQTNMVLEELGELVAAINRNRRGRIDRTELASELADVLIVCAQLRESIGPGTVDLAIEAKLARLEGRLAAAAAKEGAP